MSGITHTITSDRKDDIITVTIFGVPARHTKKRRQMAEERGYRMFHAEEIQAMSERRSHYVLRFVGEAFETFTFEVVETHV